MIVRLCGFLAYARGHRDEAIELYRRVLEQDPLSGATYHNLGQALTAADRWVEAEEAYRHALEIAPQRTITRGYLALALLAQGRGDEALAEARAEPHDVYRPWALAIVQDLVSGREQSEESLRQIIERFADDAAYQVAEVYAMRRETDSAFAWLDRAHRERDSGLAEMKLSSRLRPLHGDPRWSAFLTKMGLAE